MFEINHSRVLIVIVALAAASQAWAAKFVSHPPERALPGASAEPLGTGPNYYVDAARGDDAADGNTAKPWKTIGRGLRDLKPGDTLVLRAGTYYETVKVSLSGTKEKPVTIRSYPNELAIIDAGFAEFFREPDKAWESIDEKISEYRSTKSYQKIGPLVQGLFGDSLIPLHGYRHRTDLVSDNRYWNVSEKLNEKEPFNAGPGLWYDATTGRIHCRLAHTNVKQLGEDNYRGVTDPRKVPLVVAGAGVPLSISGAKHVRLHGLAIRGGSRATVDISKSEGIELDRLTVHGASPAIQLSEVNRLRVTRSAIRGISAPWSSRAGHKYRGASAYLIVARPTPTPCRDVAFAHCELTDSHDGPYIGTIKGFKLHHSLIDNFNDDGIYLTAAGVGGPIEIYQNVISRCLHCFSFAGKYEAGAGVSIYRNVFDLRRGVHYHWPKSPDDPGLSPRVPGEPPRFSWAGRLAGDHGSPTWEPMRFYHNTVVYRTPPFRQAYGCGLGGHINTKRMVFNNIFVDTEGMPGLEFAMTDESLFEGNGNLHWSMTAGSTFKGDFFAKFRGSPQFKRHKWGAGDMFADPMLALVTHNERQPIDPSLIDKSPARDAGIAIPMDWPDPLRGKDAGKPDLGAIPSGMKMWQVGVPTR